MNITVNGGKIPGEAFEQELETVRRENPDASKKDLKNRARDNLIDREIIRQEALKKYTSIAKKDVNEEYGKLIARHGGKREFFLRYNLAEEDEDRVKEEIAGNIRLTRFLEELSKDVPLPGEDEVRALYDDHPDDYMRPEQVHAAHIVKKPDPLDPWATVTDMRAVREKLLDGEDFAKLADECSGCEDPGGDLGYFTPGKMVEEFDTVVFSMKPGEISPVFRTQFGLHVAKVYELKPPEPIPFGECREQINEQLLYDRRNDFIAEWVDERKKDMKIEIND